MRTDGTYPSSLENELWWSPQPRLRLYSDPKWDMLKNSINSVNKTQFRHFFPLTTLVFSVTCQFLPPCLRLTSLDSRTLDNLCIQRNPRPYLR